MGQGGAKSVERVACEAERLRFAQMPLARVLVEDHDRGKRASTMGDRQIGGDHIAVDAGEVDQMAHEALRRNGAAHLHGRRCRDALDAERLTQLGQAHWDPRLGRRLPPSFGTQRRLSGTAVPIDFVADSSHTIPIRAAYWLTASPTPLQAQGPLDRCHHLGHAPKGRVGIKRDSHRQIKSGGTHACIQPTAVTAFRFYDAVGVRGRGHAHDSIMSAAVTRGLMAGHVPSLGQGSGVS